MAVGDLHHSILPDRGEEVAIGLPGEQHRAHIVSLGAHFEQPPHPWVFRVGVSWARRKKVDAKRDTSERRFNGEMVTGTLLLLLLLLLLYYYYYYFLLLLLFTPASGLR